ncbi:MAG: hypothetical protein IKU43_05765, partial [Clostridia bacterium]|nr:hypothetical protein [Clostridia bacterium]
MKKILMTLAGFALTVCLLGITVLADGNVAKVGETEYATIEEAIAAWTSGTTLTLLDDVQLSDVIKLDNREPRTLDLGEYTMTAAKSKNAITLEPLGDINGSKPVHYFTVNADESNPGGISAPGKVCIESIGNNKWACRMEIVINGGVYSGSYTIKHSNSMEQSAPWITINGGVFNSQIYTDKAKIHITDGLFLGNNSFKGTETGAYTVISGGRFKSIPFMTKGAGKEQAGCYGTTVSNRLNYDVDVYVDDEGYYCVSYPIVAKPGSFGASIPSASTVEKPSYSDNLVYSNVTVEGALYYTDANVALEKNISKSLVTLYAPADIDLKPTNNNFTIDATAEGASYTGDVVLNNASRTFTIKLPATEMYTGVVSTTVSGYDVVLNYSEEDGIATYVYSLSKTPTGDYVVYKDETPTYYNGVTLQQVIDLCEDDSAILVSEDESDIQLIIRKDKAVTLTTNSAVATLADEEETVFNNVIFTVENGASFTLDGFTVTGLSYIIAITPENISVTNCDIDITTDKGHGCPPSFISFNNSNGGSVELVFTNNTLLATSAQATTHGIAGWNSIESAVITGNTFGSEDAPFTAAAIKLMNFVDDAEVVVEDNVFYVESKDTTWGPNAIQFFQNNSRAADYTVAIANNSFFVDEDTAAVGVNTNAMGKPVDYAGGATVEIDKNNTVNGKAITIQDVIAFGNGINDEAYTRGYIGVGVEKNADDEITGGWFNKYSLGLEAALAEGYSAYADGSDYIKVMKTTTNKVAVEFEEFSVSEGEVIYDIVLTADDDEIINRLNSVDLTFVLTQVNGDNDFEILASNKEVTINPVDNSKFRYEFHYDGKDNVTTDTSEEIIIGQVKFTGYGEFRFAVDTSEKANETNAAHATKATDNIVDTFIPKGDGVTAGVLDIADSTTENIVILTPTRKLVINIDFPNAVNNNALEYQAMQVKVTGEDLEQPLVIDLGTDSKYSALDVYKNKKNVAVDVEDLYEITIENLLTVNTAYTVEVSGAGYRTARYTVTMNCDEYKTLNFWNNVKDNDTLVEEKKDSSAKKVTFLAGDIVKDSLINIYDLSAVVSYFGENMDTAKYNDYAKYDLNRDGKIDSKDVAYVLVS